MLTDKLSLRFALMVTIVACLAAAPSALGAKGAGGGAHEGGGGGTSSGGGSISLVVLNSSDGLPHWGGEVTFNVSTTATEQPFVNLLCYQSGALVAEGWEGYFEGSLNSGRIFVLYSGVWQSGAADCTAWLDMHTKRGWKQLASTSFHVYA
jgi:hypothetical protein